MKTQYFIEGVAVDKYTPEGEINKTPIIMVHGGQHGSWAWKSGPLFSARRTTKSMHLTGITTAIPIAYPKKSLLNAVSPTLPIKSSLLLQKVSPTRRSLLPIAWAGSPVLYASTSPVQQLVLVTPVMPVAAKADPFASVLRPLGSFSSAPLRTS